MVKSNESRKSKMVSVHVPPILCVRKSIQVTTEFINSEDNVTLFPLYKYSNISRRRRGLSISRERRGVFTEIDLNEQKRKMVLLRTLTVPVDEKINLPRMDR